MGDYYYGDPAPGPKWYHIPQWSRHYGRTEYILLGRTVSETLLQLEQAIIGDDRPAPNGDAFEASLLDQLARQERDRR